MYEPLTTIASTSIKVAPNQGAKTSYKGDEWWTLRQVVYIHMLYEGDVSSHNLVMTCCADRTRLAI
jgi:hypothetical protein